MVREEAYCQGYPVHDNFALPIPLFHRRETVNIKARLAIRCPNVALHVLVRAWRFPVILSLKAGLALEPAFHIGNDDVADLCVASVAGHTEVLTCDPHTRHITTRTLRPHQVYIT